MPSIPRAPNRNHTYLKEFHKSGEVELFSSDKDVIERAIMASKCPKSTATFVYFDGEEDDRVTGQVISIWQGETRFRFSVMPDGE